MSENHRLKVIKTLSNGIGSENPNWKGGRSFKGGYVIIRAPNHPNAHPNGYYPEHRIVMENEVGRLLRKEEVVHHINGVKTDNRPENLVITTTSIHSKEHWKNQTRHIQQSENMKKIRKNNPWSTKKLH